MKRCTALILSVLILLSAPAGCAKKPAGLFYDLTGLDPAATMVTIEGREVPVEMYLYWVLYAADYIRQQFPDLLLPDGSVDWDARTEEGITVRDYVLRDALDTAKMYSIVEKWAGDYGVTLDEKSEQAMEQELQSIAGQLGGEEAMEQYLASKGITLETNRRMTRLFYLYANMLALTKEEGSPLYIDDETLYQYEGITPETVLADHILLLYPEEEGQRPAARESMEDLLSAIRADEDPVEAFQFAADNYSEDEGRAYYPNGYLVTEDAPYVQAFKDTALSLEEYEISDVVESEFGWHILMRKPLRDYVADLYLAERVTEAMESAEVVWSGLDEGFDAAAFCTAYWDRAEEEK